MLFLRKEKSPYFWVLNNKYVNRNSSVGIVTDYGLDDRGGRSSSPGMVKNILFCKSPRPGLGSTQPPIHRVPGALSPGVKLQLVLRSRKRG
jgi:hypothetical protein